MAYNENLSDKIRTRFSTFENIEEKAMMGGLTFMLNGKMCDGIIKDELMCRIDPTLHETLIEKQGCKTMDFTSKPMKGYIMIDESGMQSPKDFDFWMDLAIDFNAHAKASKKKK